MHYRGVGRSGERGGTSLADFAKANPQRSDGGCTVCRLDQADEIDAFYRDNGAKHATVHRWLAGLGLSLTKSQVMAHYQAGHSVEGYRDG